MISSKLEVLVDFGPKPDQKLIDSTLKVLKSQDGIKEVVFKDGAFMVETMLPNQQVIDMVAKSSGRRAVLQGFGESQSAVAMVSSQGGGGSVMGVVRFHQVGDEALVVDGSVDALPPGAHGLHVRSDGDLSEGCRSVGPHYDPHGSPHGSPGDPPDRRHAGDLGNIVADEDGRATFRIVDNVLKIPDMIGRAIAITERRDDLGRGASPTSKLDGDSGPPIACGIIARSAGIFQNPKRICQCDGVVVWDERDRPLAGKGRRVDGKGCCGDKNEANGDKHGLHGEKKPCCKV